MQNGFGLVANLSGGFKTYHLVMQEWVHEEAAECDKVTKTDDLKAVDCQGYSTKKE